MKVQKTTINYVADILIGLGFLISLGTGIALLFKTGGGYMGGRGVYSERFLWKDIHTWSSILMASGVFIHLILHWNWIVCMTKKLFGRKGSPLTTLPFCPGA